MSKKKAMFIRNRGGLPDYSGYNITRMYSLFKTSLSTINYAIKIEDEAGTPLVRYVFFDDNGEISMNSKVSVTTTIGSDSLQYFVDNDATGDLSVIEWFCNITAHSVTTAGGQLIIYDVALITNNGKVSITTKSGTGERFRGSALSEIAPANDWTISTVTSHGGSSRVILISTLKTTGGTQARFTIVADRLSSKDIVFYRNTGATNYFLDYISQEDTFDQKRITVTYDAANEMKGYYNSVIQDTTSIAGVYTNEFFIIGHDLNAAAPFQGQLQCVIVHDAILGATSVGNLDTLLNEYFSF